MKKFLTAFLLLIYINSNCQILDNVPCSQNPNNGTAFDWTTSTYGCNIIGYPSTQIESPFHAFSLNNPNINSFATNTVKDYLPAEGWEYLQKDFGTSTQPVSHPYMILYNKNSGMLRIFIAITQLFGQNDAATISLTYLTGSKRSAVLEHLTTSRVRNALDNYNNNVGISVENNYFANSIPFWLHADFPMNYDPCHCNYRHDLFFEAKLSSTSTLSFKLNGTAIQDLDNYGRSGVNGKTSVNGLQPAISVYKDASNALNLINGILNDPVGKPNKFQNFLSYLPVVGKALTLSDFFLGLFKDTKPLSATPLSFKINLTANGNISYTAPYKPISLNVPGSYQASVASSAIPYYNNGLGVFTLIKTPVVKMYATGFSQVSGYCDNDNYTMYQEHTNAMKLAESIKYAINPNAGMSLSPADIDIRLSWVFFSDGTNYNTVIDESDAYNAGCFGEYEMYRMVNEQGECDGSNTIVYESGHTGVSSGTPALKVTAKLKALTSGQDFVFTAIYKCTQVGASASDFSFDITPGSNNEHLPLTTSCTNNFLPQATTTEIKAICNSSTYITKVNQFQRIESISPIDSGKVNSSTNTFNIYPNPASSYINTLLGLKVNSNVKITLYDITGRFLKQLLNVKLQKGTYNYRNNLLSLNNGTYILVADFDGQRMTQKLIIQK